MAQLPKTWVRCWLGPLPLQIPIPAPSASALEGPGGPPASGSCCSSLPRGSSAPCDTSSGVESSPFLGFHKTPVSYGGSGMHGMGEGRRGAGFTRTPNPELPVPSGSAWPSTLSQERLAFPHACGIPFSPSRRASPDCGPRPLSCPPPSPGTQKHRPVQVPSPYSPFLQSSQTKEEFWGTA